MKHFCRDRLKVSEMRNIIVFISMQNLQDVKVLRYRTIARTAIRARGLYYAIWI